MAVGLNPEESKAQSFSEIIQANKVDALDELGQPKQLYQYVIVSDKTLTMGRCNLNQ
jgi:hypothetical protein